MCLWHYGGTVGVIVPTGGIRAGFGGRGDKQTLGRIASSDLMHFKARLMDIKFTLQIKMQLKGKGKYLEVK